MDRDSLPGRKRADNIEYAGTDAGDIDPDVGKVVRFFNFLYLLGLKLE